MIDRTRGEKRRAQDIAGAAFIMIGGIAAVSIVLSLQGQVPSERVAAFTWPVVELLALFGAAAALFLTAGLAALGSTLILRSTAVSPWRPLSAIAVFALGFALILGAVEGGGTIGAWLPGLIAGFAGRALGAVLGLALVWLAWTLFFSARPARTSAAEAVQRIGLSARHEAAAGVSPAEAALLVTEPRAPAVPGARRDEVRPIRVESVRPFSAPREAAAPESRARRADAPVATIGTPVRPLTPSPRGEPADTAALAEAPAPPVPSWEAAEGTADEEDTLGEPEPLALASELDVETPVVEKPAEKPTDGELDEEPTDGFAVVESARGEPSDAPATRFDLEALATELAEKFELEDLLEEEDAEEESPEEADGELEVSAPSAPATPGAAWEQISLFDEEEDDLAEDPAVRSAKVELTPAFDFDSGSPAKPAHEPESEDPFAAEPAPAAARRSEPAFAQQNLVDPDEEEEEEEHEDAAAEPVPEPAVELRPQRAVKPTPAPATPAASRPVPPAPAQRVVNDDEGDAWSQLVFDAGCAILEQKRVAVSMLERRFQIDFDAACRVLDELQEAGLIGPYMGGRTRDILLTREEWLAHAPHAS